MQVSHPLFHRVIELPADVEVAFSIRVSDVWCWLEMPSDTSGAASDATDIGSAIVGTKTSSTAALHQRVSPFFFLDLQSL